MTDLPFDPVTLTPGTKSSGGTPAPVSITSVFLIVVVPRCVVTVVVCVFRFLVTTGEDCAPAVVVIVVVLLDCTRGVTEAAEAAPVIRRELTTVFMDIFMV